MSTQQDIIRAFMKSLDESNDGGKNVDAAFKEASSKNSKRLFTSMQDVIDSFISNLKSAENVDDFLTKRCGIYLDNMDRGSITGIEAGGTRVKNLDNIVNEDPDKFYDLAEDYRNQKTLNPDKKNFTLNEDVTLSSNGTLSFTKNGLNVHIPKYDKIISDAYDGNETAQKKLTVINGLYSWWIEEALRINQETYGDNFTFTNKNATATNIRVDLDYTDAVAAVDDDDNVWDDWSHLHLSNTDKNTYKLCLQINLNYFNRTDLQHGNNKNNDLVHTMVHEFTHGIMNSNVNYFNLLPAIIAEGTAELTRGGFAGYSGRGDLDALLNEYLNDESNSRLAKVIAGAYSKNYLDNAGELQNTQYNFGFMLLRYFAKQCATKDTSDSSAIVLQADNTVTGSSEKGQLFKANNGIASVLRGDKITTDSEGNINKIVINNEKHIIATPESKSSVIIENKDLKQIAWISGSANINGNGDYITSNFTPISLTSPVDKVTINGSWGNDLIYANGDQTSVIGANGNDTIHANGNFTSIYGNKYSYDGNVNEIVVNGDYALIRGNGKSTDKITLNGNYADQNNDSVAILYGDDTITYAGGIFAGDGDDEILVNGNNNYINAGSDNDTITIQGNNNQIYGDIDAQSGSDKFILTATSRNNTIRDFEENEDILWFESNEIYASSQILDETVAIIIQSGLDTIVVLSDATWDNNNNEEDKIYYDNGQKHTTLKKLLTNIATPTIYGTIDGDNTLENNRSNVLINTGNGNDSIYNYGDTVTIISSSGDDSVYNGGVNSSINAGEGNDSIFNQGDSATIIAEAGNDTIYNGYSSYSSVSTKSFISGGTGNDSILNYGDSVVIGGNNGNDTISNAGVNSSISGGDGDDFIESGNNNITIHVSIDGGEGNDSIKSWSDYVTIDGGAGNDSIHNEQGENISIDGGAGSDTIYNSWNSYYVTINAGDGDDSIVNWDASSNTINGGNGNDSIFNEYGGYLSINGGNGDDYIENISAVYNGRYVHGGNYVTINAEKGNDLISFSEYAYDNIILYNAGDGNDTIEGFNSWDTLSISGTKYSTTKSDDSIIVTVLDGSIILVGAANLSEIHIDGEEEDLTNLTFNNKTNSNITLPAQTETVDASERTKPIRITGNTLANSLFGGKGNDTLAGTEGNNTLTGGKGNDIFIYNGGNDIITDYEKGKDKISLDSASISNFTTINKDVIFTLSNNNSLTLNNMADKQISFLSSSKTTKLTFTNNASLNSSEKGATLIPATTEFSAVNYSKLITINAENVFSAVNIIGNNKANRIIAGNYGSTLNGGKGKDSLIGSNSSDIFIYENKSGNKVIQNYSSGDTISLVGAQISDASIKSNDVILKVGSKKITVKGAASQEITISEDDTTKFFVDNILYDEDKTSAILSPKFSAKTEKVFDSTVSYIDASNAKKKLILTSDYSGSSTILGGKKNDSLTGNSGNDILYGGKGNDSLYGSSGNDTLWGEAGKDKLYGGNGSNTLIGGKGNDSLWGGNNTDTFIYSKGDGKDIIYGFDDIDILQITDTFSTTYNSSKSEIYFKVGSTKNAITLKNFTATNFNINNDSYQISGSTLLKK